MHLFPLIFLVILQSGATSDQELKEAIARFCQVQEAYELLTSE